MELSFHNIRIKICYGVGERKFHNIRIKIRYRVVERKFHNIRKRIRHEVAHRIVLSRGRELPKAGPITGVKS